MPGWPTSEFNPESETHHPLLIIKAVEPGCTTELQIENTMTGKVARITSTDNEEADDKQMEQAVLEAFRETWHAHCCKMVAEDSQE